MPAKRAMADKERRLLAALQVAQPEPCCVGGLARAVWPEHDLPPENWQHGIIAYVTRLRARGAEIRYVQRHRYLLVCDQKLTT